jgi:hypothetical protein
MKKIWEKNSRKDAEHIINTLLNNKLADGGWIANFQNEFFFRALQSLTKTRLSRADLLKTLGEMARKGATGAESFEVALNKIQHDSWQGNQEWTLHFPWYVLLKGNIRLPFSVTACKTRFTISKWSHYEEKIRRAELCDSIEAVSSRPMFSGLCITARVMGRNHYEAWEKLAPASDVFRGIVELTFNLGRHSLSVPPKPKCAVPHHLWAALFPKNGSGEYLNFTVDEVGIREKEITVKRLAALKKNSRFFRRLTDNDGTIDGLLLNCVRLYAQAMDERLEHRALLTWWQLAEAIALSARINGDTKIVAKRLSWYCRKWKMDTTGINECLEKIAEHRNEIVHRGNAVDVDEEDCNFMKTVCERAILWLASNRPRLRNLEVLERIYQFNSQTPDGLDNIRCALKLIR